MNYRPVIIGGLVLGFATGIITLLSSQHGANKDELGLHYFRVQSFFLSAMLRAYCKSHGHYPGNDEGLWAISPTVRQKVDKSPKSYDQFGRTRVTSSGVLTWWGDPIIYENRRGFSSKSFIGSCAADGKDNYSYRVDKDIYLWSVGAKEGSERWSAQARWEITELIGGFVASIALLAIFVLRSLEEYKQSVRYKRVLRVFWLTFQGLLVTLFIAVCMAFLGGISGCGCPGWQTPRTLELTRHYTIAMRTYRDHGVISVRTYDKIARSLKQDEKDPIYYGH